MPSFNLTWSDFAGIAGLLVAVSGSSYFVAQAQLATVEARLEGRMALDSQAAQADRDGMREDFETLSSEISGLVRTGLEARTDEVVFALTRLGDASDSLTVKIANLPVYSDAFVDFEKLAMAPRNMASSYEIGDVAYGSIRLTDLRDDSAFAVQRIVSAAQAESGNVQASLELDADALMHDTRLSAELIERQIENLSALLEEITGGNR